MCDTAGHARAPTPESVSSQPYPTARKTVRHVRPDQTDTAAGIDQEAALLRRYAASSASVIGSGSGPT
jgi:hypothetical protein